ncbi:FAD-dependent oxidoreductase [Novosphingobium sp. FSY-8]|uniref:FAD-dependent oxidoreductase n=1 Tax=Novosphingobium ovatum TaxID=1908523 RepID=A0ABW9XFS9_9SPHN|nr:FAD-dependent oxidoreductase [Novosphingobium ovatum]NBC37405.1 FAD-dependent oxidoreductase [Novosphingobium ovatum]
MALRHILTPFKVGPVTLPNRVVRTGHGTGLGLGTMNDTLIDYHVARARGGVGLTIIELLSVASSAYPFFNQHGADMVSGYRRLMDRVAPFGMKVFQQIGHLGNEIPQADGSPPWSSSDTVGALLGVQAEPMGAREIEELKEGYRTAVRLVIEGGLDGVELHMAHGYLMQQFLSPLHNHRTDAYGGSFENRLRLPLEILEMVRAMLPPTMALGVRLSPELLPGGMTEDDVAMIAAEFRRRGLIDFVNLTLGTDYNPHKIIGAMHEAAGYEVPHAAPVRAALDLPILVTGRFRTLEEADQVIHEGAADLVALTRAHIADPDLVAKTVAGAPESVRPCIGCNHGCIGGLGTVGRMGCTVNVAVGAEATLSEDLIQPTDNPKRVLVVGGGPAGLEAARIAAKKGHKVILAEASGALGGAINAARRAPRRAGIGDITEWLEREVYRLGVDVRLGTYVEADDVTDIAPDAVIIATGSLPRVDGQQHRSPGRIASGMERRQVISSHDLLLENSNRDWGSRALVYDDTGHYEGVAAAEFLIERGVAVTFATGLSSFAPGLEASLSAEPALERLARGDFRLMTYARLDAVQEGQAIVSTRFGGAPETVAADTVVFVSHNKSNRDLVEALAGWPGQVAVVGDARSPRYLQTAIREGHLAARAI